MAKTKALISFAATAKLICAFVFAYADCWFSNEVAHLMSCMHVCMLKDLLLRYKIALKFFSNGNNLCTSYHFSKFRGKWKIMMGNH